MIPAAFVGVLAVGSAFAKPKPKAVISTATTADLRSSETPTSQAPATSGSPATSLAPATSAALSTTTVKATTTAAPAMTVKAATTVAPVTTLPGFGSGTLRVNDQIAPGRYSATAAAGCYWAGLSGTSGQLEDVLSNDNATGHVIVDILPTDAAFQSARCGLFAIYTPPATPAAVIKDGDWVVGEVWWSAKKSNLGPTRPPQVTAAIGRAARTQQVVFERLSPTTTTTPTAPPQ
jgi:hypothetical protein